MLYSLSLSTESVSLALLERDILQQVRASLHINIPDDLLVVGLPQLLCHSVHLTLHIILQDDGVHGVLVCLGS